MIAKALTVFKIPELRRKIFLTLALLGVYRKGIWIPLPFINQQVLQESLQNMQTNQGIGQIMLERTVYDDDGQLITGSWLDYAMPRADDLVSIDFSTHNVPCVTNPLGIKGCGEAGNGGAMPAVMNAVLDALAPKNITDMDAPASPHRVWQALQEAAAKPGG